MSARERIFSGMERFVYFVEGRFNQQATPEQAVAFLEYWSRSVLDGDKERQVICANLLGERGEAAPLVSIEHRRIVPHVISIKEEGKEFRLVVADETWKEALRIFTDNLGCDLEAEAVDVKKGTRKSLVGDTFFATSGMSREEAMLPTNQEDIFIIRVKEFDRSGYQTLLGFEIRHQKAFRRWRPLRRKHISPE